MYKFCVQSKVVHILRGTDLPDNKRTYDFLAERQERLNDLMPTLFRDVNPAYRSLPVTEGGLGLTNLPLAQKAARTALLIDIGEKKLAPEIEEMMNKNKSSARKTTQALYAVTLCNLVYNNQKYIAKPHRATAQQRLCCTNREDSLWLSSPPNNPNQVLNNDALMIAIWLRYGQDGLIPRRQTCLCTKKLTLEHAIGCKTYNTSIHNLRHNAVTKIIGTALAQKGVTLYYERYPGGQRRINNAPKLHQLKHKPDILIYKESDEIALDTYIHSAHSTNEPKKDMHRVAEAIKDKQYGGPQAREKGKVHYILWDTAARAGPGVCSTLRRLGLNNGALRAIQFAILHSNAQAYKNVMQRITKQVNSAYLAMHNTKQQIVPQHFIEDAVTETL